MSPLHKGPRQRVVLRVPLPLYAALVAEARARKMTLNDWASLVLARAVGR